MTLEIEYMRCSLEIGDYLFVGTEERMLFVVDTGTFKILGKI